TNQAGGCPRDERQKRSSHTTSNPVRCLKRAAGKTWKSDDTLASCRSPARFANKTPSGVPAIRTCWGLVCLPLARAEGEGDPVGMGQRRPEAEEAGGQP